MTDWVVHPEDIEQQRQMVEGQLRGRGIHDESVLRVMQELPRRLFLPESSQCTAFSDGPLPIGYEQTISQPYIAGLMTEQLEVRAEHDVLEIGTGSGYQTALLARLAGHVFSIERIAALGAFGKGNVERLGIANVTFYIGDGTQGWPQRRVFDRILVAAAGSEVPRALWEQLKEGGKLIMPIGGEADQRLVLAEKVHGQRKDRLICFCRFVKLIGAY